MIQVIDKLKKFIVLLLLVLMSIVNKGIAQTPADDPGGELTGQSTSDGSVPTVPFNQNMNVIFFLFGMGYVYYFIKKNPVVV